MRKAFQDLDPDSTNAAYISSDSDVPPDGPAFRRYVSVRLSHRHDEKHATRQGDGHKVLDMAAGTSHSILACYDGNVTTAKALLLARASLDTEDNRGLTALNYAQLKSHTAVGMLLRHHAANGW